MSKILIALAIAVPLGVHAQDDPSKGVGLLLGIGSRVAGPSGTNYKTNTGNVLETSNLGRATPQGLVGLSFPFCESDAGAMQEKGFCGNMITSRLNVFVSAQFSSSSDTTIAGFTIGLGFHVSRYLHAMVGFSMSPINEPAPGFRNAAAQYVSAHQSLYPGIDPAKLASNAQNAFDGFQYVLPPPAGSASVGTPIYPGDVLTTHYRGGVFIGVAFPLTLRASLDQRK